MSLLLGPMRQHIPGFKELSDHKDIIEVKPGKESVYSFICQSLTEL